MANSSIVSDLKDRVIKELINYDIFLLALDAKDASNLENGDYVNKYIFRWNCNPNIQSSVGTFITIMVHIPTVTRNGSIFVRPIIEFNIYSHNDHMVINNINGISDNRNDYISRLIDERFNGRDDFGYGMLRLRSNIEDMFENKYPYRRLIFETVDLNDSLCY